MTIDRATIRLTTAQDMSSAVGRLLSIDGRLNPPVVIAAANESTGSSRGLGSLVRSSLQSHAGLSSEIQVITPPTLAGLTWHRVRHRRADSVDVDLQGRGGRLPSVRLAAAVATAGTVIAVNDLGGETGTRPTIALGIWGRYADGRDRIGFQLSMADKGAAAEIALAVQPTLIIVADRWRDQVVLVIANDQIAAELAGLALRQITTVADEEPVGPWEDALVQRATELHLGVLLPENIAIEGVLPDAGEVQGSAWNATASLAEVMALKLGVVTVTVR